PRRPRTSRRGARQSPPDLFHQFAQVDGPEENCLKAAALQALFIDHAPAGDDPYRNPLAPARELVELPSGVAARRNVRHQKPRQERGVFRLAKSRADRFVRFNVQTLLDELRAKQGSGLPIFTDQKYLSHPLTG